MSHRRDVGEHTADPDSSSAPVSEASALAEYAGRRSTTAAAASDSPRMTIEYAAATCSFSLVVCQMYASDASTLAPAPVNAITTAKTSKAKIRRRSSATWIEGLSIGKITWRTRWKKPAPNTSAAST